MNYVEEHDDQSHKPLNLVHFVLFFQDVRMVDPNFIKIFKLAQLSIEYLLVCNIKLHSNRCKTGVLQKSNI